jgi:hypothetical protein
MSLNTIKNHAFDHESDKTKLTNALKRKGRKETVAKPEEAIEETDPQISFGRSLAQHPNKVKRDKTGR